MGPLVKRAFELYATGTILLWRLLNSYTTTVSERGLAVGKN